MTKTPEEMALEYIKDVETARNPSVTATAFPQMQRCFLAGYQAAQQWISVKESEPSDETWVLGTNGREIECVFKHFTDCYSMTTITHWQPLPAAPKEEV